MKLIRARKMSVVRSIYSILMFGLLFLSTSASAAVIYCVSTAQELQQALTDSSDGGMNAGQDSYIEIVKGTYKTGTATANGPFTYSSTAATGQLEIDGGFSAGCTGEARDATLTVLDGKNATQVLKIQNSTADVSVDFLTVQNGESTTAGGGAAVNTASGGGRVYMYWDIFQNNHTASIGGGFAIDGAGSQIAVVNSLIVNNSADGDYGAGFEYSRGGSEAFVDSNTVSGNTTTKSGGTGGLYCCGNAGTSIIDGNIFWQNTNFGIALVGTNIGFDDNDYGTVTGFTPNPSNLSTDPKFVDPGNGNYRLAFDSPLLGAFSTAIGGTLGYDLVGDSYPYLGFADIGAYEDTIFTDHGFEGH
jgi:hypothetical protein